ncbi:MAG: alpha,alpha-phosphotrehalase [Enterococcus sp.]
MSFKEQVIYQIYPKSFMDTNRDGMGDLQGITQKIPYLEKLGIDMIWLSPIYKSPQKDNGYDVADYTAINPMFGTMEDFDTLIKTAKAHGIEIMLDMVFNHVSIEHEWFQKALAGDKKYQDYFILRDEPTDWVSKFGGNAWAPFGDTGKYYLHLYDVTQADLDWRNPEVREELFDVLHFWMDKGIKGFRFDVINVIGKDEVLKDCPQDDGKPAYTDRPINHEYIQMMNRATFGKDSEIITVGEMSSTTIENCVLYTNAEREELTMTFNFHHLKVDYEDGKKWTQAPFDFEKLKELFHTWGTQMSEEQGWNALFWNNHDQPRAINRFIEGKEHRVVGAKMLASMIHLNRGTPYIYMGEEIGMIDPDFDSMDQYIDIESLNAYQELLNAGKKPQEAFEIVKSKSRDNSRIPVQWTAEQYGGFSEVEPWISVGKSVPEINVEKELNEGSIFSYYQKLIQLRKDYPVIAKGSYEAFASTDQQVYGYIRRLEDRRLLVLNNFFPTETTIEIPKEFLAGKILISNYDEQKISEQIVLKPYQSLAIYC